MTKTYTPLIIEGKIHVVVDAPEEPLLPPYRDDAKYLLALDAYNWRVKACTKYETLPEHAPYWKERIGQRVKVEIVGCCNSHCTGLCITINSTTYAIPPQQKQGDEWGLAEAEARDFAAGKVPELISKQDAFNWHNQIMHYLRNNYSITKK